MIISLFVIANSSSAKMEQRSFSGNQNRNVTEQTTLVNPSRLENSTNVVSDQIEISRKTDKPKEDSKKPQRRYCNAHKILTSKNQFLIFI